MSPIHTLIRWTKLWMYYVAVREEGSSTYRGPNVSRKNMFLWGCIASLGMLNCDFLEVHNIYYVTITSFLQCLVLGLTTSLV